MFRQLLEQSRQLTNHIVSPGLTPIDRGLEQIEAQTRRLLKRAGARQDTTAGSGTYAGSAGANGGLVRSDGTVDPAGNEFHGMLSSSDMEGLSSTAVGGLTGSGHHTAATQSMIIDGSDPAVSAAAAIDSRTAYLLAKQGFDPERVQHTLAQIDLTNTFEPLHGLPDADIEAFLRNEHENIVSIAIEETKSQVAQDFERSFELRIGRDWTATKKRIFDQMGHQPSRSLRNSQAEANLLGSGDRTDSSILQLSNSRHTVSNGTVITGGIISQPRIHAYAAVVKAFNEARRKNIPFNPIASFGRAADSMAADSEQQLISRCWTLISMMLGGRKGLEKKAQGHFATVYKLAEDPDVSEQATLFRSSLIKGGRSWLQEVYSNWISDNVRSQYAEIGGMPTVHSEVDAHLKITHMKHGRWTLSWLDLSVGGTPFWAHVFVLVRMGLYDNALEHIQRHQADLAKTNERNFLTYFKAWMDSGDGRLPKTYRDKLLAEWNGGIRDYATKPHPKGDLFKYALYKILGRCEMTIKTISCSDVIFTVDDYLWLQLMLVQEEILPTDAAYERYTLRDFSSRMQKYGIDYFKARPTWFMVLLLCGEFERAVSELHNDPAFSADGIHFATALAYYGALRVPENPRGTAVGGTFLNIKPITLSTGASYEIAYFHFAKTIISFVRSWGKTDPIDTLHYIYLIGLFGTPLDARQPLVASPADLQRSGRALAPPASHSGLEYTRLAHAIVCEFVLSSKMFSEMLGQIRPDGSGRTPGHIDTYRTLLHLTSDQDFIQCIVLASAYDAENESRLEEAIYLYHLAGMPDKVIHLLNTHLGERLLQQTFFQTDDMSAEQVNNTSTIRSTTDISLPLLSLTTNPVQDTEQLLKFYQSRPLTAAMLTTQTVSTCTTLVQLSRFHIQHGQGRDESALATLYTLNMFPSTTDIVEVQSRVDAFLMLDESVARVMPQIMYMALQSLDRLYRAWTERRGSFGGDGRVVDVRERARALMMFAGLVQYRIPSDIFGKMNRLDVMMG
ncbi:hypothetical protein BDV3_004491 [Batrachochytrium dendrobatidis]|uniref:Nuclear pore protein n=1 Tax=Batrachochytrium dendrobatidis (strain JEL423) TaxID=403673 RepID=A0A177WG36_BATDL|nr:nuclear pore complex subunit [Batrachochytrium dendrobatidis]KAK5672777.1 nuclear pore complex subunit [Batrachochytrium dendrobatidis]OAJ39077.1 hypothetical protein BDEG_22951 [Batrachochytrium dendrobatidis JEL423]